MRERDFFIYYTQQCTKSQSTRATNNSSCHSHTTYIAHKHFTTQTIPQGSGGGVILITPVAGRPIVGLIEEHHDVANVERLNVLTFSRFFFCFVNSLLFCDLLTDWTLGVPIQIQVRIHIQFHIFLIVHT